ncbi:hypothetical protein D9M71_216960 [compost metagenome]
MPSLPTPIGSHGGGDLAGPWIYQPITSDIPAIAVGNGQLDTAALPPQQLIHVEPDPQGEFVRITSAPFVAISTSCIPGGVGYIVQGKIHALVQQPRTCSIPVTTHPWRLR